MTLDLKRKNFYTSQFIFANMYQRHHNDLMDMLHIKINNTKPNDSYGYKNTLLYYNMSKKLPMRGGIYFIPGVNTDYFRIFGTLIMVSLILIGISPVFSDEYNIKMDSFILSTKYGKSKAITSKIIASIIYIMTIAVFFILIDFLLPLMFYGNYSIMGWNHPIQALIAFVDSPYNFTNLEMYFIEFAYNLFASLAFGIVVLLLSTIFKSNLLPLFIGGGIFALPIILVKIFNMESIKFVSYINELSIT